MPDETYYYLAIYSAMAGIAYPALCRYRSIPVSYKEWLFFVTLPVALCLFGLLAIARTLLGSKVGEPTSKHLDVHPATAPLPDSPFSPHHLGGNNYNRGYFDQ